MEQIKMQIFGSFLLSSNVGELDEESLRSRKLMRLLVYLIMNRNTAVTQQKLIDIFWGDNSRSPESALKNLIYRLRNNLKVLGDEEYICTAPGAYRWNPKIPVETDYEYFEELTGMLRGADADTERKKKLCMGILDSYHGNISGRLINEPWIMPKVMLYRSLYIEAVKKLCQIYEEEENWKDMEMICNRALAEDSLDEDIHCYMMRSLYRQNKYDLAMSHYEKANKMFYENLGLWNPEKLSAVFQEMMSRQGRRITGISDLMRSIRETEEPTGAFFCDSQMFRQIYRMEARRKGRTTTAEHVMLLTIRKADRNRKDSSSGKKLEEGAAVLEKVIHDSLRCGDVVAKFGPTQYALMLPACSYQESIAVADRIQKKFWESKKMSRVELMCEIAELAAPG